MDISPSSPEATNSKAFDRAAPPSLLCPSPQTIMHRENIRPTGISITLGEELNQSDRPDRSESIRSIRIDQID